MKKTETKAKRVYLISEDGLKALEDEFKMLARSIGFCIDRISKNDIDRAIWTLERMKENINKTLKESKL